MRKFAQNRQTENKQRTNKQTENSKTEATLILCGSSGEQANNLKSKNADHVHTKGSSPLQELGGGKAYRIYCSLFKTDNLTPTPYTVLSKGIFRILTFKNRKKGQNSDQILTKFYKLSDQILT